MTATSASLVKLRFGGPQKIFCLNLLGGGPVVDCGQARVGQPWFVLRCLPVDGVQVGLLDLPRYREVPVAYRPVVDLPYRCDVRGGAAEEELVGGEEVVADEVLFLERDAVVLCDLDDRVSSDAL